MNTPNRQEAFNFAEKLADLNLTPSQRQQALGAMQTADLFVDAVLAVSGGLRRIAEALALKPSLKA